MEKLWYREPAKEWEEALPLGNGRLGAMVFGGVEKEVIQVNEESIWYGGKRERLNPDAKENLPKIRQYIREGQIQKAHELLSLAFTSCPQGERMYQTLGEISIEMKSEIVTGQSGQSQNVEDANEIAFKHPYYRELDLSEAVCRVRYENSKVASDDEREKDANAKCAAIEREYFISHPDDCMVIHMKASKGQISFVAKLNRGKYFDYVGKCSDHAIFLSGNLGKNAPDFAMCLSAKTVGGNVSTIGQSLIVENADEVFLYFSADSTFHHSEEQKSKWNETKWDGSQKALVDLLYMHLEQVSEMCYEKLLQNHIQDYQSLYNRVSLTLTANETINLDNNLENNRENNLEDNRKSNLESLATDERLQRVKDGGEDVGLAELLFDYGRYLLISCSRPGNLPANLQGIWNKEFLPPWDSKYTININTEMNYWPAESCALPECHEPLFDHLERMRTHGRKVAREMYGCRGFMAHHNTDIYADCAPQDNWGPSTYWVMGAAWLSTHLWMHYEYTRDYEFLKKAYPILAEAALFFLDYMEEKDGYLVTNPSSSPENIYIMPNGQRGSVCVGSAMDMEIIRDLFTDCVKAAKVLDDEIEDCKIPDISDMTALQNQIAQALDKLPPIQIDSTGRIMEWMEEYEEKEPGHRHMSHLYALYPSDQISVDHTPQLADAARKTLSCRLTHGGGHTGWSRAWIINFYAKLRDGERAWENIGLMLTNSTYPNLFDRHPPFQIDGNFGVTAAIAQMLVQSREDEIILLPALPKAWKTGQVTGLRVKGAASVDLSWENGSLTKCTIHASDKCGYSGTVFYEKYAYPIQLAENDSIQLNGMLVRQI